MASPFFKKNSVLLLILVVLTFTAYSFILKGSFKTRDDEVSIVRNEQIRSLENIPEIFTGSFFGNGAYYRPLVSFSYMIEYRLFRLNPAYYYLTNIIIHIAVSMTLFWVMNFIFRRRGLSFAIALLFALHPVHWEAVANISGRAILLCAFFYINAFFFFCRSREGRGHKGMYIVSLLVFMLALLSKESAGVLPLILSSYQFFVGRRTAGRGIRWFLPVVPFFFIDGIYILIRRLLGITHLFYWRSPGEAVLGFVTFLRSVITHLRVLVMPVDLQFDRSRQLFSSLLNMEVLMTLLFFALLMILFVKFRKRLSPQAIFFMTWFCIELGPVSQILVSLGVQPGYISTAEHFLYTPSIGIFVLLGLGLGNLYRGNLQANIISPRGFKAIIAGLYVFLFLMTVQANVYATHEISMFERALELSPHNIRIRSALGFVYATRNRFKRAEYHFRKLLEVDPFNVRARIALGKSLCDQGKLRAGIREYERIENAGDLSQVLVENLELTYKLLRAKKSSPPP